MAAKPSLQQLAQVPLFAGLKERNLKMLSESLRERSFAEGETIAAEGKSGVGFFVIAEGEASVSVDGKERATLRAGDHFGELALIDDGSRTATVTATTPLHCYAMTSWEFRPLVQENSTVAWHLLQNLTKRLREADSRSASQ
ncbi:MAG: cyclic nucleotide-binding domain-containing protein [Actinobacteria bacterium]|nr:cyclic nucleotide-binding domain-containing protein [Actinomycetota bacterium]